MTDAQLLGWLAAVLQPLFRLLGLFATAPVLSSRNLPMRVKVALAAAIAVVSAPLTVGNALSFQNPDIYLHLSAEVLMGLAIGMVARLVLAALDVAGELIGLQMGLSFAGFFDPLAGQANAVGRLVTTLALALFVAMDGPAMLVAATVNSLHVFPVHPVGPTASATSAAQWLGNLPVGTLLAQVFESGLLIALPCIALLLFINIALGLMARVAPQLNLFSIGFPVTLTAGLVLLAANLPTLAPASRALFERLFQLIGL